MNCPKTVLQSYDMNNTLEHAENKTIEAYKGANEDETAKKRLRGGRKLKERNKHLNSCKKKFTKARKAV